MGLGAWVQNGGFGFRFVASGLLVGVQLCGSGFVGLGLLLRICLFGFVGSWFRMYGCRFKDPGFWDIGLVRTVVTDGCS